MLLGKVIKLSSKKTMLVLNKQYLKHKKYLKIFKSNRKFLVHYNCTYLKKGMNILFNFVKKVSKLKSWKLFKIISK
ncbi:30S ribosomal protein S17 [Candidatus Vidania fulgoroideorum]